MSQATEEIKLKLDIIDLLSEYISLRPAGANWKGLCPFHHEKTPSFMVSRDKQIWHCFGCSEGGDIFSFIIKMEGLEFPEALRLLAQKAGVKLAEYRNELYASERNRFLDIISLAARFYHKILLDSPAGQPARDYLAKRGVTVESIEDWQIGFVPDQWDILTKFLLKRGFGINDLTKSGLTINKESGGWYDRFRGRIMFPLWDVHNNVIGFTGRLLDESKAEQGGKYVNSPQSAVFDKGRFIYGLNIAKQEIKKQDRAICAEGQMDVIACHQAGQTNVVATSGTALTLDQIKLIKRFTNNVYFSFDADAAGQTAALRGIDLGLKEGLNIKVITLPDGAGKDPDECLKTNPAAWFKQVDEAKHIMDFIFTKELAGKNLADPAQRTLAGKNLLTQIAKLADALDQDFWLKKLAGILDIREDVLYERLKSIRPAFGNVILNEVKDPLQTSARRDKSEALSEQILALLLIKPELKQPIAAELKPETLTPGLADLYKEITENPELKPSYPETDRLELLGAKILSEHAPGHIPKLALDLVRRLNAWYNSGQRKEIERQMREAEKTDDRETINKLLSQFKELI